MIYMYMYIAGFSLCACPYAYCTAHKICVYRDLCRPMEVEDNKRGEEAGEGEAAAQAEEKEVENMSDSASESEDDSDGDGLAAFLWGRRYNVHVHAYTRTLYVCLYRRRGELKPDT